MRSVAVGLTSLSLALLLLAPGALAASGPSTGPYAGVLAQDETHSRTFDTHGDNPCLAVYLPKLYVVTLTYAPATDILTLSAAGQTAVGENGVATVSFVANYCTRFPVSVTGTDVALAAAYAVAVESVFTAGIVGEPVSAVSASAPCTPTPNPLDCVDRLGEDLTSPLVCEREDMLPGIRQC